MPGLFDKSKNKINSDTKLAAFWTMESELGRGYFEELYKKYPADVSKLLAGEELLPDDDHKTLEDWVKGSNISEKWGDTVVTDLTQVMVNVHEISTEPAHVLDGEKFKVRWKGVAGAVVPEREDRIEFKDDHGTLVKSWTVTYPEAAPGPVVADFEVDGLPAGMYTLEMDLNTDGAEPGGELTEQGYRTQAYHSIFVGLSNEALLIRYPEFGFVSGSLTNVGMNDAADRNSLWMLREAFQSLATIFETFPEEKEDGIVRGDPDLKARMQARAEYFEERAKDLAEGETFVDQQKWPRAREEAAGIGVAMGNDIMKIKELAARLEEWCRTYL